MLAEDVQVELVTKARLKGRADVRGRYFGNDSRADDWQLEPGFASARLDSGHVATRHAPYVIEAAEVLGLA